MTALNAEFIQQLKHFSPELIFFDIDGTLLDTQGHYSPALAQQLQRLHNAGIKLAIASGRPAIAAQFLFDSLPLHSAGLFCTGAELYDPTTKTHLHLHHLNKDTLETLLTDINNVGLYCECYTPDFYTAGQDKDIADIHSQHLRVKPTVSSLDKVLTSDLHITKLLLGAATPDAKLALSNLAERYTEFEFAFAHFLARPDWVFASVVSRMACKKAGFKQLVSYHNTEPSRVMAFGDSHSDSVFIQQAGLGIAMGNADDDLKALANAVTLSSDKDGVAEALSHLFIE